MSDDEGPPPLDDMTDYLAARKAFKKEEPATVQRLVPETNKQDTAKNHATPSSSSSKPSENAAPKAKSSSGSGLKKGFFNSAPKKKSADKAVAKKAEPAKKSAATPVIKPTGNEDGEVLHGLKNLGINKDNVPEWMQPNDHLMNSVASDPAAIKAMSNPKLMKAIDEISKDPQAFMKYQNDPEVTQYLMKMLGKFGESFEHFEKNKNG